MARQAVGVLAAGCASFIDLAIAIVISVVEADLDRLAILGLQTARAADRTSHIRHMQAGAIQIALTFIEGVRTRGRRLSMIGIGAAASINDRASPPLWDPDSPLALRFRSTIEPRRPYAIHDRDGRCGFDQ